MLTNAKTRALTLIALMLLAALAGCLGADDTTDDDTDNGGTDNGGTDNGGTDNNGTDNGGDDRIDVGTITCGPDGSITIAGSSTVFPLAEAWAEYYSEACPGTTITVEGGGSGAGAGRVCANSEKGTAVDIGDMSRDWKSSEATRGDDGYTMSCLKGDTSLEARQIVVAYDGLSVVVKKGGAAETCVNGMGGLTVDQLRWIFSAETAAEMTAAGIDVSAAVPNSDGDDTTHKWSELSSDCPDAAINLAYPDADSGTYEYFFEAALHEAEQGFRAGEQSADDNVIVSALTGDETAIGYFGYAYYQENQATLTALPVQNDAGTMVTPSGATVADGSYNPLARPIFMNLLATTDSLSKTVPFVTFGLGDGGDKLVNSVGYVAIPADVQAEMEDRLAGEFPVVCGPDGSITIAGSSTVFPVANAWAESYSTACPGVTVTVEGGGSGAGAGRVCANSEKGSAVDIGDMSRGWKSSEASVQANGFIYDCLKGDTSIDAAQFVVAVDGLSVVVKKGSAAETCINGMGGLTQAQLRWVFSAETAAEMTAAGVDVSAAVPNSDGDDTTHKWSELSSDCPDAAISLAYPDADSGTYEYFYEAALHEAAAGFRSGEQSADDNVIVNAITGDETAIGYFGYAYYQENQATLTAVAIQNDDGNFVAPDEGTVRDGSYNPLSRPIFMNLLVDADSLADTLPFLNYGLFTDAGQSSVSEVGYVSLNNLQEAQMYWGRYAHLLGMTAGGNEDLMKGFCSDVSITIAGSSTVFPVANAWAEDFKTLCAGVSITVEGGGSGAGAGRVCANSEKGTPVNIGDMSRGWKESEATMGDNGQYSCLKGDTSITVTQLVVAFDGLSVVVKQGGAADQCISGLGGLTAAQLRWVFSANTSAELSAQGLDVSSIAPNDDQDGVREWSDLSADCADAAITLAYPDADSGTYEYFYEEVMHEHGAFASGEQSAEDNVLVSALTGDENAIGYFGYAYYQENQAVLTAIAVSDNHTHGISVAPEDAVAPSPATVSGGTYTPLSRPIFMNVNNDNWDTVSGFLLWAFSGDGSAVISEVGYVPLDDATWLEMHRRVLAEGTY